MVMFRTWIPDHIRVSVILLLCKRKTSARNLFRMSEIQELNLNLQSKCDISCRLFSLLDHHQNTQTIPYFTCRALNAKVKTIPEINFFFSVLGEHGESGTSRYTLAFVVRKIWFCNCDVSRSWHCKWCCLHTAISKSLLPS